MTMEQHGWVWGRAVRGNKWILAERMGNLAIGMAVAEVIPLARRA
jgi:hypothetical protein